MIENKKWWSSDSWLLTQEVEAVVPAEEEAARWNQAADVCRLLQRRFITPGEKFDLGKNREQGEELFRVSFPLTKFSNSPVCAGRRNAALVGCVTDLAEGAAPLVTSQRAAFHGS